MNHKKTLRLAHFYRTRLGPLIADYSFLSDHLDMFKAEFFEAIGWLVEGVFCGYFAPLEADILWRTMAGLREQVGSPSNSLIGSFLASEIDKVYSSDDPFRESRQMPDGAQKAFELPLFPHALQVSDQWVSDRLARLCCSFIWSSNKGLEIPSANVPVDPNQVTAALASGAETGSRLEDLLAGFIRILEHMEASKAYFELAKGRASSNSDFDSYRLRIGSLNAWRIPSCEQRAGRRLNDLFDLLEFAIRASLRHAHPAMAWSLIEVPLRKHYVALVENWENDHLMSLLEYAHD